MAATPCPKCHYDLNAPGAPSCERCGVIFAKLAGARRLVSPKDIVVTTGDLHEPYQVIGPVFTAVSNRGLLSSQLDILAKKHHLPPAAEWKPSDLGWAIVGEWPVGQREFPRAFIVCMEELKRQAMLLGADAIVWLRQDTDLDTAAFQWFYMQAYGTAVVRQS